MNPSATPKHGIIVHNRTKASSRLKPATVVSGADALVGIVEWPAGHYADEGVPTTHPAAAGPPSQPISSPVPNTSNPPTIT